MTGHAVARQCLLTRGLVPVLVSSKNDEKDAAVAAKQCVNEAIDFARAKGLVKPGQPVVTMYNVERQCAVIRVVVCPGESGTSAKSGGNGASME
jgi:pyruvate kinase